LLGAIELFGETRIETILQKVINNVEDKIEEYLPHIRKTD
jgi:hypothetical protein